MNFFPFFSSTGQRSCQEIMWEDSELTRFVSFHSFSPSPSSCSLSVSHTHTNTYARSLPHKQGKPTSLRSANRMHEKAMKEDIRINILICMYYTLFTSRSFPIIPTQLWLFALSIKVSLLLSFSIILSTFVLLIHSPTLSHLLMSHVSVSTSLSFSARCLWFTFEVFIPPAAPLFPPTFTLAPHSHGSSFSFSHLCLLLLPLFFCLPLCLLDNFLRCWHFHHSETNRNGGGCNTHPCHHVSPSSSLLVDSPHIFFHRAAFWDPSLPPSLSS